MNQRIKSPAGVPGSGKTFCAGGNPQRYYTTPKTLYELKAASNHAFAHTAYQVDDGELVIIGKYCRCTYLGEQTWDVWLCNPSNMVQGLSGRRIQSIRRHVSENSPAHGPFKKLTGEGVYLALPTEVLIRNRAVFGIKIRRQGTATSFAKREVAA